MVQTHSFLSCRGGVGRGGREIWCPLKQTSSFYLLLKWLEAVPSGFYGEKKSRWLFSRLGSLHHTPVCSWHTVSQKGRDAGWCFCAGGGGLLQFFLQRIFGKQSQEPCDLWVRISEYFSCWRAKGSHNHCGYVKVIWTLVVCEGREWERFAGKG